MTIHPHSSDNLIGHEDFIAKINKFVVSSVPILRLWFGRVKKGDPLEKNGSWAGPIEILTQIEDEDLAQGINSWCVIK